MRLSKARVENYRSIRDSGEFEVEPTKTIIVGPNEAGKTALLKALERVKGGPLVKPFVPLRDYPRSEYHKIQGNQLDPKNVRVVSVEFALEDSDKAAMAAISPSFSECRYTYDVYLDDHRTHSLIDAPAQVTVGSQKDSLRQLAAHVDSRIPPPAEGTEPPPKPSDQLNSILATLPDSRCLQSPEVATLRSWVDTVAVPYIDESNSTEVKRLTDIREVLDTAAARDALLALLSQQRPTFVYFSTYTRVRANMHLGLLADAIDQGAIDPTDDYNFGNFCLLKLLNFSARELSDLGKVIEPNANNRESFEEYRAKLDERDAILNAASVRLTEQIREVWQPSEDERGSEAEDYVIRIHADQQYLKVDVMDSMGAAIEIDQRSEGFQWLVSFFIVFFAQAAERPEGSILLLDEPGLSLHGLKQREFRNTLSRLAQDNQLLFTTHSPFLVGPDELDAVRVVEMVNRTTGTRVHSQVIADDPASLLPLQEALGYDLAQSMFAQQRNLILEGLTDYWYIEATAELLRASTQTKLNEQIALVPASSAGKVVYFATILHAHSLKVAALLDSDAAGDQAAQQDTLVNTLGNKRILRTKDAYSGPVAHAEIEDLLRETLVAIGKDALSWDVEAKALSQPGRPIVDIFEEEVGAAFSKYRLAKAYVRWSRDHEATDLTSDEQTSWFDMISRINAALK